MTTTANTTAKSREDLDAETYAAYLENGRNGRATSRATGVSLSTVQAAIRSHLARLETVLAQPAPQVKGGKGALAQIAAGNGTDEFAAETTVNPAAVADKPAAPEMTSTGRPVTDADRELRAAMATAAAKGEGKKAAGRPAGEQHKECTKCGFGFKAPQARPTCRIPGACDKRAAERDAAATAKAA